MLDRAIALTIRAFGAACAIERAELMREAMALTAVLAPA